MNEKHLIEWMQSPIGQIKYSRFVSWLYKSILDFRNSSLDSVIFVATTGRSGSASLARLFSRIDGCVACHEPYPKMTNDEVAADGTNGSLIYDRVKAVNIRREALTAKHYIETSHLFITNFIEYAAKDFEDKLGIIHLTRPPLKVAMSIYQIGNYPGTTDGNRWWLDYKGDGNHILIEKELETSHAHPFYKCLWYWYEVEARIRYWKRELPNICFVDFKTEQLNDRDSVVKLLNSLSIGISDEEVEKVVNIHENLKTDTKKNSSISIDEAESMHRRFKDLLRDRKYSI